MARSRREFISYLSFMPFVGWALPARSQGTSAAAKATPSVTAKPGEWRYLNSDLLSTRYSPLDQITKDNFKDLKIAWRWKPAIGPGAVVARRDRAGQRRSDARDISRAKRRRSWRTASSTVRRRPARRRRDRCRDRQAIVDVEREWTKRPRPQGAAAKRRPRRRLLDRRTRGAHLRHHHRLLSRRARTPRPARRCQTFGVNGAVDLMKELNVDFDHVTPHRQQLAADGLSRHGHRFRPRSKKGFVPSSMRNTPGYVMAFDARTGKQKWAFHTVPKSGRARRGDLGAELQHLYRQHRRVGADLGRSRARLRLSARRNADRRLLWRSSSRQQSVRQFGRLPSISRPESASGTTRSRTTTSGTTISRPRRRW